METIGMILETIKLESIYCDLVKALQLRMCAVCYTMLSTIHHDSCSDFRIILTLHMQPSLYLRQQYYSNWIDECITLCVRCVFTTYILDARRKALINEKCIPLYKSWFVFQSTGSSILVSLNVLMFMSCKNGDDVSVKTFLISSMSSTTSISSLYSSLISRL